jgi:hypothetical protein
MTRDEPVLSNIIDEWGVIKPYLDKLCEDNPEFGLKSEHVYDTCVADEANLWMAPEGFIVTRFVTDDDTGVRTLFLWVACSYARFTDVGSMYLPFLEEVGKYMHCRYIEAWSSREGMERYLAKQNYKLFYRSFRKEIHNG